MDRYMWQEDEWTTHSLRLSQMQVLKPVILTLKTVTATNRKVHSSGYILSTIWRSGCQIQHSQFHRRKCFYFEIIPDPGLHRKLWGGFYPSFPFSYLERLVRSIISFLTTYFHYHHHPGVGPYEFTIKDGRRWSASQAYMHPSLHRTNLTAHDCSMVTRVLFEGKKAVGVEYVRGGETIRARANKEVILSLGTLCALFLPIPLGIIIYDIVIWGVHFHIFREFSYCVGIVSSKFRSFLTSDFALNKNILSLTTDRSSLFSK